MTLEAYADLFDEDLDGCGSAGLLTLPILEVAPGA
jgi:hypothetical protein